MDLSLLGAAAAAGALAEGRISSEELVAACLARIEADEERVQAWAFIDPEHALRQARAADSRRREGKALGPLHGLPVGVKDIIDTADMPTENGTVLHAGRAPSADASLVSMLRAAGAIIMGKTVTTELATYSPGKTRNPHNPEHTPGGSSSGSAAAVAAHMVPLAIGTQTNGSVIRPAAYCGVVGYKPSFGLIPRHGVLKQSRPLDQIGVIARSVEDAALLAEQLIGFDRSDPDTRPRARMLLRETAMQEPPAPPTLAFVKTPMWKLADAQCQEAFAGLAAHLGERVEEHKLPAAFKDAWKWHQTIMEADLAKNYESEYRQGGDKLSAALRAPDRARAQGTRAGLQQGAGPDSRLEPRARAAVRARLRRDTDSRHGRHRAAGPRIDRISGVLHAVDACAACRRLRCRCCKAPTACRWACNWWGPAGTMRACCAPRAG